MNEFYIINANGEKELFDYKKLENSLRKVDASDELISQVISEVSEETKGKEIITTQDIYRKAFSILRKKHKPIAVRYSL